MITKITTSNIDQYNDLFARAWQELQYRNAFSDDELKHYDALDNKFTGLEEYFTKIKTLVNVANNATYSETYKYVKEDGTIGEQNQDETRKNKPVAVNYEFIMLPLDEQHFTINADTRDIAIPAQFKQFVGVQGDHYAETLIFSIDRFFDYVDLLPSANDSMHIYIQWKDSNGADRATPVNMIHYDAKNQKILFGWPLNRDITAAPGTLQFSVRFLGRDGADNTFYSFNTKTHQITIVPALCPDFANVEIDTTSTAFLNAISDSKNTSMPPAETPYFYLDLESTREIGDNAYTFSVAAASTDSGSIEYCGWYRKAGDGSVVLLDSEIQYVESTDSARRSDVTYYVQNENNKYEIYTGETFPEDTTIYEKRYIHSIASSEDEDAPIVGCYYATAKNRTGVNHSDEIMSTMCEVKGPSPIIFTTNLIAGKTLEDDEDNTLLVKVDNPDKDKTALSYTWKYSETSAEMSDSNLISGAKTETYTPEKAGWYQVSVIGRRNRENTEEIVSNICKVAEKLATPDFTDSGDLGDGIRHVVLPGEEESLTVQIKPISVLQSDEIIYEWYAQMVDQEPIQLTEEQYSAYNIINIVNNTYDSTIVFGAPPVDNYSIYCRITNTLNNKRQSITSKVNVIA